MSFLLDTNIVSALLRDPNGIVAARVAAAGPNRVMTSIVVAAEVLFGIEKDGSVRRAQQWEILSRQLPVLPFLPPAELCYGRVRADMERRGETIGANDLLIAVHALTLGAVMVTDNVREFGRVPGLEVRNWLRD